MTELTLIRHARTAGNETGLILGALDLDEDLAQAVHPLVDAARFRTVFCSPLARARRTATLLVPGREVAAHDGLRERSLGQWAGLSRDAVRAAHPEGFLGSGTVRPTFTPPGGERMSEFLDRVRGFLADALARPGPVLAVTHHGVVRVARALHTGEPLTRALTRTVPHLGRLVIAGEATMFTPSKGTAMTDFTLTDLDRVLREHAEQDQDVEAEVSASTADEPFDALGFDSLSLFNAATAVEDELSIRLSYDDVAAARTPAALLDLIRTALAQRTPA